MDFTVIYAALIDEAKGRANMEKYGVEPSQTDWARIDLLQDKEIDYSEIPDLGEDEAFWNDAEVVVPPIVTDEATGN